VVVGVWDSGIDVSVFRAQLYRNPGETPGNGRDDDGNGFVDDVHGIAFTLDSEKSTGMLFPHGFDPAQEAEYRGYAKGFADLRTGLDTEAAQAFRQKAAGLPPDRLKGFFRGVREYGFYAHGTHVAGIAARGNPAVRLLVARFSSDEFLSPPSPPTPERSRRWVGEVNATVDYFKRSGVRVVNMSWGYGPGYLESLLEDNNIGANAEERRALARRSFDIEVAGLRAAIAAAPGILFVASAGNEDEDNRFGEFIPSSLDLPNLLTVGAVDIAGDEADFTSYGAVHVYANGYEVPSFVPGGDVQRQSGTSMAAPQVVNLAAKLLTVRPDLDVAGLKQAIVEGTEPKTIGEGKQIRLLNPRASLERARDRPRARSRDPRVGVRQEAHLHSASPLNVTRSPEPPIP
jgi:subtilisin family serine protease